jgi:hypothetical protein
MNQADVDRRFSDAETAELLDDVLLWFSENPDELEEFESWRNKQKPLGGKEGGRCQVKL